MSHKVYAVKEYKLTVTPTPADTGFAKLYFKADGELYKMFGSTESVVAGSGTVPSNNVVGPTTTTANNIPQWDSSSNELKDGLAVVTSIGATGSDNNIPTEKAVRDAMVSAGAGDVTGPTSAVNNNVVVFDGTTGKAIKDSGSVMPTGTIVGESDTQTIINKTINADSNTISDLEVDNFKSSALTNDLNSSALSTQLVTADEVKSYVDNASGTGEINTASNLSGDEGIYASKSGANLQFKSLTAGSNITLSSDSNAITINSAGGTITPSSTDTFTNKTINADNNTVTNIRTSDFRSASLTSDLDSSALNTQLVTANEVKSYINEHVGASKIVDAVVADSGGDYTTVGAAITAGAKNIYVKGYIDIVEITKLTSVGSITIQGAGRTLSKISINTDDWIDGTGNLVFKNLRIEFKSNIQNSIITGYSDPLDGIIFDNCKIDAQSITENDIRICDIGGKITIEDCSILGNTTSNTSLFSGSSVTMDNVSIKDNTVIRTYGCRYTNCIFGKSNPVLIEGNGEDIYDHCKGIISGPINGIIRGSIIGGSDLNIDSRANLLKVANSKITFGYDTSITDSTMGSEITADDCLITLSGSTIGNTLDNVNNGEYSIREYFSNNRIEYGQLTIGSYAKVSNNYFTSDVDLGGLENFLFNGNYVKGDLILINITKSVANSNIVTGNIDITGNTYSNMSVNSYLTFTGSAGNGSYSLGNSSRGT